MNEEFDDKKRKKSKRWSVFLSLVFDLVKLTALAFIIVWPIHRFVFQPFYVSGPSMEPSFFNNEYLIIEKISYLFRQPQRGEVIIFKSPEKPKDHLIKRVIGLPNERVVITGGEVYIYNGKFVQGLKLDEKKYLSPGMSTPGQIDVQLKENEYYVLGDNRIMSLDSRIFGPINQKNFTGRAWLRGWPFKRIGLVEKNIFTY